MYLQVFLMPIATMMQHVHCCSVSAVHFLDRYLKEVTVLFSAGGLISALLLSYLNLVLRGM